VNNNQLYIAVALPMLTVILAWLANRSDINRLGDKLDRNMESLRAEIAMMRSDHHKDLVALMGYMVPLHERMAKLESQK
jgi:hypothetical protein